MTQTLEIEPELRIEAGALSAGGVHDRRRKRAQGNRSIRTNFRALRGMGGDMTSSPSPGTVPSTRVPVVGTADAAATPAEESPE